MRFESLIYLTPTPIVIGPRHGGGGGGAAGVETEDGNYITTEDGKPIQTEN